jgi:Dynamin family
VDDIQERLIAVLNRAADILRQAGLPSDLGLRMEELAKQVRQPCTVAVVGPVKVGKSTFVNALLGGDHAKVGTTETTATINYFSYVDPKDYDPDRPVRCHWRGGGFSDESRAFLDDLQGNDLETLRRADGIDHLEYFLPNAFLKQITLVDTPGTGAVVDEHQDRTAEFMRLNSELRERHDRETRRFNDTADAIIYLVGPVAKVSNERFLEAFAEIAGGSSALNAIGVMSKIELQPEVMARRHELSAKIATQLKAHLNTVIPVGAGLRRELDRTSEDRERLARLITTLRRIPSDWLETLLASDELFREFDPDDLPVSPDERRELLDDTPWGVFTTMARVAADPALSPEEVVERLEEMCGFGPLWRTLNERFIQRGHILRCYRITRDARSTLNKELKYTYLPQRREESRRERARLDRFLAFIQGAGGDSATADELRDFVRHHLDVNARVSELEELHAELDLELSTLLYELHDYNADFEALQKLENEDHGFSPDELEELRPLLGLYGSGSEKRLPLGKSVDVEYISRRQTYWRVKKMEVPYGNVEYVVADRAFTRYGVILDEISEERETATTFRAPSAG